MLLGFVCICILTVGAKQLTVAEVVLNEQPKTVAESPKHPIRMGLQETRHAIHANHETLSLYRGPALNYTVLNRVPHSSKSFTQGLAFGSGHIFEGTGIYGKSELIKVDPSTGKSVLRGGEMNSTFFGEGMALVPGGFIVRITYNERRGFVYNSSDFTLISEFDYETYTGQGWGLAYDSKNHELIVSDGSDHLFFWDADTMREKRFLTVTLPGTKTESGMPHHLKYINELEVFNGALLGNIWYSEKIVRISLTSGEVEGVYDFSGLPRKRHRGEDCFNGIAHDEVTGDVYLTGKYWKDTFRVRLSS